MQSNNTYSLEKYRNGNSKHICPNCNKKSFVRYINNETNTYVNDLVGRCDRQDNCNYHYPPKDYFKDNSANNYKFVPNRIIVPGTKSTNQSTLINSIPFYYIERSAKTRNNNLYAYLYDMFDWDIICKSMDPYFIGCTKDKAVIFPQIDINGNVRTGKIMQYNPTTGRRVKDQSNYIDWLHNRLKKQGKLPENYHLEQCLFGEHLIRSENYRGKTVCIVESEKTALIASICLPDFVWMASGGIQNLSVSKLNAIKDHKIVLYPDASIKGTAFEKWKEITDKASSLGYDVSVSRFIEDNTTNEQKAKGYDLGDYCIDKVLNERSTIKEIESDKQSQTLKNMLKINPALGMLINKLDLVEV